MVTIYNTTLSATSQRHFSDGLGGAAGANGLNASLIIAAIAIGVAVPNILARNRVNAAKRRAFEAQIREQHAQGHFIDITKL